MKLFSNLSSRDPRFLPRSKFSKTQGTVAAVEVVPLTVLLVEVSDVDVTEMLLVFEVLTRKKRQALGS
jgi:hypothetical protein